MIDAGELYISMRKSLGSKRRKISDEQIDRITRCFGDFEELEDNSKFPHQVFGTIVEDKETYYLGWINLEDLLGMKIADETLQRYSKLDILVHCLRDRTIEESEKFETIEDFVESLRE